MRQGEGFMAIYIVTYDLNAPGRDYEPLLTAIRNYTHCKCLKSAFFIDTTDAAATIRDKMKALIDKNDTLYVMELQKHWASNRSMACADWLKARERTWD
jgi:hypothetical protein